MDDKANYQDHEVRALNKAVVNSNKLVQLLDLQSETGDLISALDARISSVSEPSPQPATDLSEYTHINNAVDRQTYINARLRGLINDLLI